MNSNWLYSALLLVGLLASVQLGFVLGKRLGRGADAGALSGAVFGLLGLLLAFAFSGATSRFEERRALITQEANAIGTAYLRLDLLPSDRRAGLRLAMQQYVQARIDSYQAESTEARNKAARQSAQLQQQIWTEATGAALATGNTAVLSLVTSALNDMFDITTTRLAATHNHPPRIIDLMLFALALMSALLAGVSMSSESRLPWLQIVVFAVVLVVTVFVIHDIEYPRLGFIRVDAADQLLIDTLHSFRTTH